MAPPNQLLSAGKRPFAKPSLQLAGLPTCNDACSADCNPPAKRIKADKYRLVCSKVAEGLYVSGEAVAMPLLQDHGITHVVNCVKQLYPERLVADGTHYKSFCLLGG